MPVDAPDNFGLVGVVRNSDPASGAVPVTKSDTNDIWGNPVSNRSKPCRGIYVGVTGNIKMTMADGTIVTRNNVPVGEWPWRVRQIWSTGTAAGIGVGDIIADY